MTSENIYGSEMANSSGNFRNATINEPRIFGGPYGMQTPIGTIRTTQPPPPLPPRPFQQQQQSSYGSYGGVGSMYGNSMYSSPYSNYGSSYGYGSGLNSFGTGFGGYGGSYGSYGGYGGYGGGYNRFGGNPMDPENRFIQIAEESSRPAFQSIESLVGAIGNIASMLDSTFFAITSSFRAILGVAANFGRLRGVFGQFWQSFAIFRGLTWLFNKILYWLRISKLDPSSMAFNEAFAAAQEGLDPNNQSNGQKKPSAWPVLVFLGFIFTAPYLIMKLLGTVTTTALEETKNPRTWVNPIKAQVKHDFQATNQQELSLRSGQAIYIAPREIQNTQKLLNTGWVLATLDNQSSGIIPLNYIQGPQQVATKPQTMPSIVETQPKPMQEAGPVVNDSNNIPASDNGFPSLDSVMEKSPEDVMHGVFAGDM